MTDLQDAILDRLVGTPIGVNWPDGPLAIAAEVVGGTKRVQFGQTDNDRGAKSEIAKRLGYPILLVEAIQGANRALAEEDDRRGFAMEVFRLVPIGGPVPKLSSREQNHIAGHLAVRVHPFVCPDADCPALKALAEVMAATTISRTQAQRAYRARCTGAGKKVGWLRWRWLTALSGKQERVLQTIFQVISGLSEGKSMGGWNSIRESARLAASERGLEEAIACCVEIARQCGLPVSGGERRV